jgi:hypothetical protein
MKLYELANPSDPYTFYAPSIEVAGIAAAMISTGFGATPVDGEGESSPVLFGWDEWMKEKGIDSDWIEAHTAEIADALDSFLIGNAAKRADVESMLEMLPDDKKQEWRDQRQDRHRSSLNQIGETAYELAKHLRSKAA